jgi:hypothetical protein
MAESPHDTQLGVAEAPKSQPKKTMSKAPRRVSCVQYVSTFNKKMNSHICMYYIRNAGKTFCSI